VAACPECGGPLVRGTFCRACGWDGELEEVAADEEYLENVDLPQGYADEDPDGFNYEAVLRREGLLEGDGRPARPAPVRVSGAGVVHALIALLVVAMIVFLALTRR
jgi:hypothetical protein